MANSHTPPPPSHAHARMHAQTVDDRLHATSVLLTELQDAQQERLAQSPTKGNSGELLLTGPSERELETAAVVRGQLATLTAQVITDCCLLS